jgi:acyl-ACP thioesterase
MKAEDGEVLAAADSQWFYFDFARKRPVRIPEIVVNGYENSFAEKLPYDFSSRKIPLPESFEEKEGFVVRKMDIDTNDHVNNAVYAAFALDYLPPVERLKEIRIEYLKAAVLSDRIIPAVYSGEERTVLNLKGEDGKPFVVIEARER